MVVFFLQPIFGHEASRPNADNIPSMSVPDDNDVPRRKKASKGEPDRLDGLGDPQERRKRAHRMSHMSSAADVEFGPKQVEKPYASL